MTDTDLIIELESALGNNLVWIADQADLGIRQKDPETLRRLAELDAAWKLATKRINTPTLTRAVLVYQAGIANVFSVDCFNTAAFGRNAKRLMQGDFRTCESFARGLLAAGIQVASMGCNMAGDIVDAKWDDADLGPFRYSARPVGLVAV
jgi:hypothetical protein